MHALRLLAVFLAGNCAAASFWFFARFTVDDAFITWRYGLNLLRHGVWGYNPTTFDLTQAYTNPIFALLSIVPAWLQLDVVLFFKLLSLASVIVFLWVYYRACDRSLWALAVVLLFLAIPATMTHAFSGLETFVYVVSVAFLFISMARQRLWESFGWTALLMLTRPEAWLLLAIVPMYYVVAALPSWRVIRGEFYWQQLMPLKAPIAMGLLLSGLFAAYALFHWRYFGHVLPNTFYIKSGESALRIKDLILLLVFLSPLGILLLYKPRLFVAALTFFVPVCLNYSSSELAMNYMQRFVFQVFAPAFLIGTWALLTQPLALFSLPKRALKGMSLLVLSLCFVLFCSRLPHWQAQLYATNYYPRLLASYSQLGKVLGAHAQEADIQGFSIASVGAVAYFSDLPVLDFYGLGSSMVGQQGFSKDVLDAYQPDMIAILAESLAHAGKRSREAILLDWAQEHGLHQLCGVQNSATNQIMLYTKQPVPALLELCEQSQHSQAVSDAQLFERYWRRPPWKLWHE